MQGSSQGAALSLLGRDLIVLSSQTLMCNLCLEVSGRARHPLHTEHAHVICHKPLVGVTEILPCRSSRLSLPKDVRKGAPGLY